MRRGSLLLSGEKFLLSAPMTEWERGKQRTGGRQDHPVIGSGGAAGSEKHTYREKQGRGLPGTVGGRR